MNKDFEEVTVSGFTFRIRRERSLLADSIIEKIYSKDGTIGAHEVIKVDCEIFDREKKTWREIVDKDLDKIPRAEGREVLLAKILELRKSELDFQKARLLQQNDSSGELKTL